MKYCDQCGAQLKDKVKFCSICGSPIASTIEIPKNPVYRICGKPIREGAGYCTNCGSCNDILKMSHSSALDFVEPTSAPAPSKLRGSLGGNRFEPAKTEVMMHPITETEEATSNPSASKLRGSVGGNRFEPAQMNTVTPTKKEPAYFNPDLSARHCTKCGKLLARNAISCPHCSNSNGNTEKRKHGKRIWGIVVAAILGVLALSCIFLIKNKNSGNTETGSNQQIKYENNGNAETGFNRQIYYILHTQGFSDGVAWIETCNKEDGVIVDSQWACIDTTGKVLFMLEPNTYDPSAFSNGVALYKTYDSQDNVDAYHIIDKRGNVVFSSKDGAFDAVIAHNGGYFAVYTYTEGFSETGYTVFFMNNKGKITNRIDGLRTEVPELINCGEGVFAEKIRQNAAAEVTYRFYDARTGNQYEIGEIGYHTDMSYIFHNGYAVIEGPRMGDIPRLVSTDGKITNLDYFGYGSYYDFGPVADGGFVCTGYYQDKVEHVWFYDINTGGITPLGNYGERVKLSRAEGFFFDNGSLLLPLVGTDGKNYYTIINKAGQSLIEPTACQSAYAEGNDRIVVQYTDKTVVYNGLGEVIFELAAGQGVDSYQSGMARLVGADYAITNTYIDLNGGFLFDDDVLVVESKKN